MQKSFAKKPLEGYRTWVGPALAGGLLLLLLGGGAFWLLNRPAPLAPPDVGKEVAELFLKQLREGNANDAWQSTTADFKSDEGRESFARYVRENAAIWPAVKFHEYRRGDLNGLPRAQCIYVLSEGVAVPQPIGQLRIAVAQEAETWKVEGLFLDPAEQGSGG